MAQSSVLFIVALFCLLSIDSFSQAGVLLRPEEKRSATVDYDVIVIGGGPAGLQALSSLGRVRRQAIMLDSGQYRNAATRHAHDVLGFDGASPANLRYIARQGIARYPSVNWTNATVRSIENLGNGSVFIATDSSGHSYSGSKVVLATGLVDILPSTPGLAQNWGQGIYWCPWCDGYEHRDQALGVLGNFSASLVRKAFTMQKLNANIVLYANGTVTNSSIAKVNSSLPDWQRQLQQYNATLDNRTLASITRLRNSTEIDPNGTDLELDLFQINFTDGTIAVREAFLTLFGDAQRSALGTSLGVQLDSHDKMMANIETMETSISGVYAVGDANNDSSTNIPHAMWSAKRAVVQIHGELSDAEARLVSEEVIDNTNIGPRKRDLEADRALIMERDLEDVWEEVSRRGSDTV